MTDQLATDEFSISISNANFAWEMASSDNGKNGKNGKSKKKNKGKISHYSVSYFILSNFYCTSY